MYLLEEPNMAMKKDCKKQRKVLKFTLAIERIAEIEYIRITQN